MRYESIADIYSANDKFRDELASVLTRIAPDEASVKPDGEKWSIQQIAEHVSMVDFGITRICAKLIAESKAAAKTADGSFSMGEKFSDGLEKLATMKVEAPDRVQPTGDVSIVEVLIHLNANRQTLDALRADLEHFDTSGPTFPHPYIGDMTAAEWLVMAGLHQNRHMKQIEELAARLRQ